MRRTAVLLLLFAAPALADLTEEAARPIAVSPTAKTQKEFDAARLTWYRATTVEAYRQVGKRNPAWDDAATRFLEQACQFMLTAEGTDVPEALKQAAAAVQATKCDDPLVQHFLGWTYVAVGDPDQAIPLLEKAVAGYREVAYPRCRACTAPLLLAGLQARDDAGNDLKKRGPTGATLSDALQWAAQGAAEPQVTPGHQREYWCQLQRGLRYAGAEGSGDFHLALQNVAQADPWIKDLAGGLYYTDAAWQARGGGFGDTVTDAGWQGFRDSLNKAWECLDRAWKLHPDYPEAATAQISVAMGLQAKDETPRVWFDRAVAAQCDWKDAYEGYVWSLLPRWNGSHEAMFAFGQACLATRRFDTEVPDQLYRIVLSITEFDGHDAFWRHAGLYDAIKQMIAGYVAAGQRTDYYQSIGAAVAWRCEQWADARKALDELGDRLDEEPFDADQGTRVARARQEIMAGSGPHAAAFLAACAARWKPDYPAAVGGLEALLKTATDPNTVAVARRTLAATRLEQALAEQGEAELKPPPDLSGWEPRHGNWKANERGEAACDTDDVVGLLTCDMKTPDSYELSGRITLAAADQAVRAGLVFGYRWGGEPTWTSVVLAPDRNEVEFCHTHEPVDVVRLKLREVNDIRVRVQQRKATVWVNEQQVFENRDLDHPNYAGPGREVGCFTLRPPDEAATPVFSVLRLKRLGGDNRVPPKLAQPPAPQYLWREAEKLLVGDGWITADFWKPSGGLFLYPVKTASAKAHVDFPGEGPWVVWMRLRDETVNQRQFQATINGRLSYVLGGNNTTSWWWWAVDVVSGKSCDVELTGVTPLPMAGWADCVLFTDDMSFVPPPNPTAPAGYTAYDAATDAGKGRRAAWLWWPMEPPADTMGSFRKAFDLARLPAKATLTVAATGPCEAWLNGQRVPGGAVLKDADVLALLRPGRNALGLQLKQNGRMPGVKATLTLTGGDGTTQAVVTDLTWKATQDAPADWAAANLDDTAWARPFARLTEKD